jgi:hypothetical protein
MAISTLDQALAGMQWPRFFTKAVSGATVAGRHQTYWAIGGNPGAGSYDNTLNGVVLDSTSAQVNGQINFVNPTGGNLTYLARFQGAASQAGVLLLCDRLWHNGGFTITSTSAQSITSPTFPARDANGSTDGVGVLLALEVSAATGAGTPTITISYTNSDGTAGRTATNVLGATSASATGATYIIGLQAGDVGVRSVQSLTLSATWTSGTMNLVAYRPIAALELPGILIPNAIDAITSGFPRLYDGSVPYLMLIPNTTTTSNTQGQVVWTQG